MGKVGINYAKVKFHSVGGFKSWRFRLLSFGFFSSHACVVSVKGRPIMILLIMDKNKTIIIIKNR